VVVAAAAIVVAAAIAGMHGTVTFSDNPGVVCSLHLPVSSSEREGQQTGVCAKKFVKFAPRCPSDLVKLMAFIEPSLMS